jgi:hypothetical protein
MNPLGEFRFPVTLEQWTVDSGQWMVGSGK